MPVEEEVNIDTQLTLNDIIIVRNIVDIAAKRGAFLAGEFKDIGQIYEKIDTFVKSQLDDKEKTKSETEGEASEEVKEE